MVSTARVVPHKLIVSHSAKMLHDKLDIIARNQFLENQSVISSTKPAYPHNIAHIIPMLWYEELVVVVIWGLFFGFMLYGPMLLLLLLCAGYYRSVALIIASLITISLIPIPYHPNSCYSYLFTLILKYHSHRGIWSDYMPTDRPAIVVGPPHGVFPFGSLLACVAVPRTSGKHAL
jgi:hypothetical protein